MDWLGRFVLLFKVITVLGLFACGLCSSILWDFSMLWPLVVIRSPSLLCGIPWCKHTAAYFPFDS